MSDSSSLRTKVITFGCWDLLHYGHINFLQRAKEVANAVELFVGVPTDDVVKDDKENYPIIPFSQRVWMLEALRVVDSVVPYHSLDFINPLNEVMPEILVIGQYWGARRRHSRAEEWMRAHGGRVIQIPYTKGISTTEIIKKIKRRK